MMLAVRDSVLRNRILKHYVLQTAGGILHTCCFSQFATKVGLIMFVNVVFAMSLRLLFEYNDSRTDDLILFKFFIGEL